VGVFSDFKQKNRITTLHFPEPEKCMLQNCFWLTSRFGTQRNNGIGKIPLGEDFQPGRRPQDAGFFFLSFDGALNHGRWWDWAHTSTLTHLMYLRILTGFYPFKKSRKPWHSQTSLCPPEWWYCSFFQVWIIADTPNSPINNVSRRGH